MSYEANADIPWVILWPAFPVLLKDFVCWWEGKILGRYRRRNLTVQTHKKANKEQTVTDVSTGMKR